MPAYPLSILSSNASGSKQVAKNKHQKIANSSCSKPQAHNTTSTRTSPRLNGQALPRSPVTPSAANTIKCMGVGVQARGGSPPVSKVGSMIVNATANPGKSAAAFSQKPVSVVGRKDKERSSSRHRVCEHGIRKTRCKTCLQSKEGGRSLCKHGRQRGWCASCKAENGAVYYYDKRRAKDKSKNAKKKK